MKLGDVLDDRVPWVRRMHSLDEAFATRSAGARLRETRRVGERIGDALRDGPRVVSVRTLPLTTLLYPTGYAFNHAVPLPWPYVVMSHRCLLVQVSVMGEIKNILWNPSDYERSRATPYFARMLEKVGEDMAMRVTTQGAPLLDQLAAHGIAPEDVDLIAFDHFHTQDVRELIGSSEPGPDGAPLSARFPNAYLLAPRVEWEDWDDLHPLQRSWFVADGKRGVPEERVIFTENDLWLGEGCLVLRTPGHTSGNQTIFCHAERGVFGCSENGTSADSWAPYESRVPGLQRKCRQLDLEVILNSNTPETAAEQYTSMVLERSVVDRAIENPAFVQMFPSSEVTPSAFAPGVSPSMIFGERDSGEVVRRARTQRSSAVTAA